jgi:hypothetical protein
MKRILCIALLGHFLGSIAVEGELTEAQKREVISEKDKIVKKRDELREALDENMKARDEATDEEERARLERARIALSDDLLRADDIVKDFTTLITGGVDAREYEAAYKKYADDRKAAAALLATTIDQYTNPAISNGTDFAVEELPSYAPTGVRAVYNTIRAWVKERQVRLLEVLNKSDSALKVRTQLQKLYARMSNAPKVEANVEQLNQLYIVQINKILDELVATQQALAKATGSRKQQLQEQQVQLVAQLFTDALRYRNQLIKAGEYFEKNKMLQGDLKSKFDATVKIIDDNIAENREFFQVNDQTWQNWQTRARVIEPSEELKSYLQEYVTFFKNNRTAKITRLSQAFNGLLNAKSVEGLNDALGILAGDYYRIDALANTNLIDSWQAIQIREYEIPQYVAALKSLSEVLRKWASSLRSDAGVFANVDSKSLNQWLAQQADVPQFMRDIYALQNSQTRVQFMRGKADDLDKLADIFDLMVASGEAQLKKK